MFKYHVFTAYKDAIKNISTSLNIFFLPCSTTLEENSSLRVNWEQLEPDDEGRDSELVAWSESDLAPPVGSIPTKGRKPTSSPKSMDAHTGSRCILSCEVAQTITLNRPFETLAAGVLFQMKNEQLKPGSGSGVGTVHFRLQKWVHTANGLSS